MLEVSILLAVALVGALYMIWVQRRRGGRPQHEQRLTPRLEATPLGLPPQSTGTDPDFLSQLSREMQHPLNGIISMAALLRESALAPVQQEYLETMSTSAEVLKILIDDLMEASLLEGSELRAEKQVFDLKATIDSVIDTLRMRAQARGREVVLDIEARVPSRVEGDKARLSQLLGRLLNSAIDGCREEEITVRLSAGEVLDARFWLLIEIQTKSGWLEPEDVATLLAESHDGADDPRQIGWALCRQLSEVLGGYVGVEAEEVHTAWVAVPLGIPDRHTRRPALRRVQTLPPQVLIVDDNIINRRVMQRLVGRLGCETGCAVNGQEAIQMVGEAHWDLVLMDCEMPGIDGYEATRRIRAMDGRAAAVPIIAVTAHATPNHAKQCRQSGMDDYIRKPVRLELLRSAIDRYARGAMPSVPPEMIESR